MLSGVSVGPPEVREAGLLEHLPEARLAGLGAEPEADLLRQRVRRADRRRRRVQERGERVLGDVRRAVVERHRLDEQHGAAGREVLTRVPGDADRVAHVVEAVEEADEVVRARVLLRAGDPELGVARRRPPPSPAASRVSIDGAWKSNPWIVEFGYVSAITTTDAP